MPLTSSPDTNSELVSPGGSDAPEMSGIHKHGRLESYSSFDKSGTHGHVDGETTNQSQGVASPVEVSRLLCVVISIFLLFVAVVKYLV